ncbi:MAG: hypothetical protein K6F84_08385 [Lachnospiraceae bacterium]|nr:hypothetical protein [Lachnospiraceae bacterium]
MNHVYFYILLILVFILLFIGVYELMRSVVLMEKARENLQKIMSDIRWRNDVKIKDIEALRKKYGSTSGGGKKKLSSRIFEKVDNVLVYSETSVHNDRINASNYIIGNILLFLICLAFGLFILDSFLLGFFIGVTFVFIPFLVMSVKAAKNYRATENQIKFFVNLVSSNAVLSTDLCTVLELCAPQVQNPIRDAILRAVNTTRISGDPGAYFWRLTREIEHPLFVQFIRNIEICSKTDANYKKISDDYSEQLDQKLDALIVQRAIRQKAKTEILIMLCVGMAAMYFSVSMTGMPFREVLGMMAHSTAGIIVLFIELLVFGSNAIYLLVGGLK